MKDFTPFEIWYGRDAPPPAVYKLQAGSLSLEFQEGDLRAICLGSTELIRRVYVAVRDVNWNTISAHITGLVITAGPESFHIEYDAFHQDQNLSFSWHAVMDGQPDGTISISMDGSARSDFRYCRIGFCVLHPIQGIAGRPYTAQTPNGEISGILPEKIAPQRMENGFEAPIFPSCSSIAIDLENGIRITSQFEGDLFEVEDQRNWTDGSFKTYCTPLSLGYPHQARPGQEFHQKILLMASPPLIPTAEIVGENLPVLLCVGSQPGNILPSLGFGIPANGMGIDFAQMDLLAALHPDHLKVELHFQDPAWREALDRAAAVAGQTGSPLEMVLFLDDQPEDALGQIRAALTRTAVARVIVFNEKEASSGTTGLADISLVRDVLGPVIPGASFVGGTNGNFAELNRKPPEIAGMDGVAYPINPQVHASDERSLVEAVEAQRDSVLTARSFCGTLPIHISSVTLKPPFNQAAREEEKPAGQDELPPNVDPRQMSLFAAAWTVGSIHSLASGGAKSITYYETTGWRGLVENRSGGPLPERYCSFPGMIYPVYWVFHFLEKGKGAALLQVTSHQPLRLDGLAVQNDQHILLIVSSFQPHKQEVILRGIPGGQAFIRRLNEETAPYAALDPAAFLAAVQPLPIESKGETRLVLQAYETVMIKIKPSTGKE